jgi:glycine/D-amino acid oxidase-like deaminating enzyme
MTILDADVAAIGAGSVGSMASWQLAERGLRVIGLDRFTIPGPFSAYAGESRVFRMVYAEGGHCVLNYGLGSLATAPGDLLASIARPLPAL